jgi:hypothetical protein
VQQRGLSEAALRAFEAERIPRVKAVFSMAARHAAQMAAGAPRAGLMQERADLLYGEARFERVGAPAPAAAAAAAKGA